MVIPITIGKKLNEVPDFLMFRNGIPARPVMAGIFQCIMRVKFIMIESPKAHYFHGISRPSSSGDLGYSTIQILPVLPADR